MVGVGWQDTGNAAFRAAGAQGAGYVADYADPPFINLAMINFWVEVSSPVVNAGKLFDHTLVGAVRPGSIVRIKDPNITRGACKESSAAPGCICPRVNAFHRCRLFFGRARADRINSPG